MRVVTPERNDPLIVLIIELGSSQEDFARADIVIDGTRGLIVDDRHGFFKDRDKTDRTMKCLWTLTVPYTVYLGSLPAELGEDPIDTIPVPAMEGVIQSLEDTSLVQRTMLNDLGARGRPTGYVAGQLVASMAFVAQLQALIPTRTD